MTQRMPTHRLVANTSDEGLWGFTVDPAPTSRMHVRCFTRDGTPTVLLEAGGVRVWEPAPGFPPALERMVRGEIEIQRDQIERQWLVEMISRWGRLALEQDGSVVTLRAYPGTPAEFTRSLDLCRHAVNPPTEPGEITLISDPEPALEMWADRPSKWRARVTLSGRLWL